MSTSKHIDKICIIVIALMLILTLVFIFGKRIGIEVPETNMGYENRIFDTSRVHDIDIVMNDWEGFIENCENEEYSNCTVVIDGEKVSNVGIRAKGNTSLSSVKSMGSQRYSLKLEFDQYEKGKSYHGLDKLCLNNLIQDNTMMKDYLVYRMMDEFGVDAPLCSYSFVTVNGEDWGLFLTVEGVEDSFLKRNYGSEAGNLYKPDSMSFGGGRGNGKGFDMGEFNFEEGGDFGEFEGFKEGQPPEMPGDGQRPDMPKGENFEGFNGGEAPQSPERKERPEMSGGKNFEEFEDVKDFNRSFEGDFETGFEAGGKKGGFRGGPGGMGSDDVKLKYIDDNPDSYSNIFDSSKTEISKSDKERLITSLRNLSSYSELESTLDIEEVLRYFVIHNFVVNGDSYTGSMIHNYYLHECDGKLSMIPWDYNLAFGTFQGGDASSSVNSDIDSPVSGGNVNDRPMVGWIFSDNKYILEYHSLFEEFLNEWYENGKLSNLIEETSEMIRPYVEKDPSKFCTSEEFEKGVEAIDKFVNLRFEAVGRQINQDSTPVDTIGLNTTDMGTMNQGFGGGH